MEIKQIKINQLIEYKNNAKKHDEAQIKNVMQSIKEFGMVQPIVIDQNNTIIIGHCRFRALKRLKWEEVPCVRIENLSENEINKLRLLDNKLNESEWDFDLLTDQIAEIDWSDFDIDWNILETDEEPQEIVEDEIPEVPEEPKSQVGDIYELGCHRLICGDSTNPEVVERLMDGVKADILITDPPYNIDYEGKTKDALKIQNDKMDNDSFRQFLVDAFTCANKVMRGGAVFYIWHSDSEGYNFRGACNDVGWKVRECLIWNKNCMVMGRQDYQWKHEPCLYGWKDGASHLWASDRKQTTVLDFARPIRNDIPPTMKPVALFAYQISNNTHEGDAVLDMFGGSGSTLIACEQLGRKCYMCELDEHYVDVIVKRYIDFTNNKDDVYVIRDGQKIKYSEI
jgi:site-specific DNA-methyltransferase (adenine-specific)